MSRRIRLWCHEGWWRIQFYSQMTDRSGTLQDAWTSHCRDGRVALFGSPEEAREYMRSGRKSQ